MDQINTILKYIIAVIATVGTLISANAQPFLEPSKSPDQYNYQHWTSDDGLPDNAVIKVIQSRDGYIWFCSYGGVTRFNGAKFYTYSSYNTPEIVNNSFTNIYEDNDGIIWAATSGNGLITIDKDKVEAFTTENGLPSNFIEGFVQDKEGTLWVATSEGLSYKTGQDFTNNGIPEKLKEQNIVSIDCDSQGRLWLATGNKGVIEYYKDSLRNHTEKTGLLSNRINNIRCQDGKVYVGTRDGLNVILADSIFTYTTEEGLMDNVVIATELSKNGWLWVGSYQGFCRVKNNEFQYFSKQHPIYGRDITSLLEDVEGNLWVSTYRGGLYKFWEGKFTNYSDYSLPVSDPYTVHSVIQQSDNKYILVFEEGVSRVNTLTNKLDKISGSITALDYKLKCGIIDSKGRFWIGSRDGLILHERGNIEVLDVDNGLINANIRVITEDSQGRIWIGTFSGITIIDLKNEMTHISTADGLSHDYIMNITEDDEGKMWIGTRNGLNVYDNGDIKQYSSNDGLAGEFVFKTFIDSEGTIWVLGNAGLARYKDGEFKSITTKNGLTSNTLFQMLEDDSGYFWFTTNQKGVSTFKIKKEELSAFCDGQLKFVRSIEYSRSDGIRATAATSSATSLKANDGKLWIATQFGVEVIDPQQIPTNESIPAVRIEYLSVNDRKVNLDRSISLPYGKNRIKIGFTGLSYRYPKKNSYKYQLVGYDEDWIVSKGELETSYTNLSDGEYAFKVVASNNDGYWNNDGGSINFTIQTPFYLTSWFFVLCTIGIVGLGMSVYNWRIASLKRARKELERVVAERTHEILQKKEEIETQNEEIDAQRGQIEQQHNELKKVNTKLEDTVEKRTKELVLTYNELIEVNKELDSFIYRAAHDIRGPIARIQGLGYLIRLQTKDNNILNLVEMLNLSAEDMNDIFYRLINIVRLKTSDLKYENVNIRAMIKEIATRLQKSINGVKCEIKVEVNENLTLVSHKETLEIILNQLIDNAYKFRKKDTPAKIDIKAKQDVEGFVTISVSDYGMGIHKGYIDKIFDMFYVANDTITSTGLGLYTVKVAAKVLKGDVKVISNAFDEGVTTFEVSIANMN